MPRTEARKRPRRAANRTRRHRTRAHQSNPNQTQIIEFYADWCGHCQAMKPQWKTFQKLAKKWLPSVTVMAVESKDPRAEIIKAKYGLDVRGYPTIFKVTTPHPGQKQHVEEHVGERSASALMEFAKRI